MTNPRLSDSGCPADTPMGSCILRCGAAMCEPPIGLVRQEDAEGCGAAVLAMLTGQTYAEAKATVERDPWTGHSGDWATDGIAVTVLDRALVRHGFYSQRRYSTWYEAINEAWPPAPFAPLHFASVVQPSGNGHFVVVLGDGTVLDPLRDGEHALDQWPGVNHLTGLVLPEVPR